MRRNKIASAHGSLPNSSATKIECGTACASAQCAAIEISKSAYADANLVSLHFWELNLQSTGIPVSRGSYLSPLGQELAPWQFDQVAVASAGLSPQPLLISAAGYSSSQSIAKPKSESRPEWFASSNRRVLARTQSARAANAPPSRCGSLLHAFLRARR